MNIFLFECGLNHALTDYVAFLEALLFDLLIIVFQEIRDYYKAYIDPFGSDSILNRIQNSLDDSSSVIFSNNKSFRLEFHPELIRCILECIYWLPEVNILSSDDTALDGVSSVIYWVTKELKS